MKLLRIIRKFTMPAPGVGHRPGTTSPLSFSSDYVTARDSICPRPGGSTTASERAQRPAGGASGLVETGGVGLAIRRTGRTGGARRHLRLVACGLTAAALGLGGCGAPAGQSGGTDGASDALVLASFYPLVWLTEQVAGPGITVGSLTPPGAEPHDAELTPAQMAQLGQADLVVTLAGLQPAVDQAIAATNPARVVDAALVLSLDPADPHFWLDPSELAQLVPPVAKQLGEVFPDRLADFTNRADHLVASLDQLDQAFADGLQDLGGATLVTTHAAFGYLARRYGLMAVSIAGVDPEQEPSPARLRQVRQEIEGLAVAAVFSESPGADKLATALADEIGVQAVRLNPLETRPDTGDYLSAMRDNLAVLQANLVPPK